MTPRACWPGPDAVSVPRRGARHRRRNVLSELDWVHAGPPFLTAFLASAVEFVEALTVILATGSVRGWRAVLAGTAAALATLTFLVLVFGHSLARLPIHAMRLVVGATFLLFGLRWLRKAILRAGGILALRDEGAAFSRVSAAMRGRPAASSWDGVAFATGWQVTTVEGAEVVIVVVGLGAGAHGLMLPASAGAVAAFLLVAACGVLLHRPLARVPENTLKLAVGVMVTAFGCFCFGDAIGVSWPGADWSAAGLVAGFALVAVIAVAACRHRVRTRAIGA